MRRQFQLRTLLIVIALCALGTWWVTLPRQTAQWFVTKGYRKTLPDEGNWTQASFQTMIERDPSKIVIAPGKRSWSDVLIGKQSFVVTGDEGRYRFDVLRGRITSGTYYAPVYGGQEFRLDAF
jgi:hypothetical protein